MFCLTRAYQHVLLQESQDCLVLFVPLEDRSSANAIKADLLDWFSHHEGQGLPVLNELIKLLLLPLYLLFWFYRRTQKSPGWLVNFQTRTFTPIRQKNQTLLQGLDVFGVHLHGQQIEITHPTKGPLITLHKFSRVGNEEDLAALNQFTERLAFRLKFRMVGQRASLIPATHELLLLVFGMFLALSFVAALVFHVKA